MVCEGGRVVAAVGALLRRGAPHTAAWDDASADDGGATTEEAAAMELVHMYVRPSRRRRGYGRALMRAVAAHARATAGVARVVLSAPSVDDEAVAFYEHLGFLWQLRPSGYGARSLYVTPSLQVAFYEHMGFRIARRRTVRSECGHPLEIADLTRAVADDDE